MNKVLGFFTRSWLNLIVIMLSILTFCGTSRAQWAKVNLDSTVQYNQIIFTDSLHGYIAASSIQPTDTSGAMFFVTSNGGRSWRRNTVAPWLFSVSTIGDSLVWLSNSGTVYYSHDGGNTWHHSIASSKYGLLTVQFVDAKNGWGCGIAQLQYGGYEGICHSSDGGQTWQSQYADSSSNPYYFPHLGKGFFIDSLHGWVGDDYSVLRTTNGGSTWIFEPVNDYVRSVYFIDTLKGWATGLMGFYRTTDGGVNWIESSGDTVFHHNGNLDPVFFEDSSIGWIGDTYGSIYHTTDGGFSWNVQYPKVSGYHPINSIFFLNKNEGWAVGNGIVLHTTNGGVTAIDETSPHPTAFRLFQNYPNPFNPSTAISYQLSAVSQVSLKVFNVLGRQVAALVNGVESAGLHTVTWIAAQFASGVYFYRLTASSPQGTFEETKQMILIK